MTSTGLAHRSPRPSSARTFFRDADIAEDPAMRDAMERGRRFVNHGLPVLIIGETGSGKELVAKALHAGSARRAQPLITLNCASIPETLVESELFGYARGAFSGALPGGMKGKIASAQGGTLFLDEIGDMPLSQQAKLLRALSEREITPLGATRPVAIEFQLICATHQNLAERVRAGAFRADLFYRIADGVLRLPALRDRRDLMALALRIAEQEARRPVAIDAAAWDVLRTYPFPGNVRQLRAVLRCACALMQGDTLGVGDLPEDLFDISLGLPPSAVTFGQERGPHLAQPSATAKPVASRDAALSPRREHVLRVLTASRWNMSAAAKSLGVCRSTLYRQLRTLGIPHIKEAQVAAAPSWCD